MAVIAQLIDWNKAFDRQDPRLGIQAFIKNGVRASIIPVLISYFQQRKMTVKWHNLFSHLRNMPGGGPQGYILGLLLYLANSNDNADHIPVDMRFKFVDDLSVLEEINLIMAGLTSYNCENQVPSDVGTHQKFLPSQNIKSQSYLDQIQSWTNDNKMKLNSAKTNIMVFNFNKQYQFSTRLHLEGKFLETVSVNCFVQIGPVLSFSSKIIPVLRMINTNSFLY